MLDSWLASESTPHASRVPCPQTQGTFTVTVKERASESCSEADAGSSSLRELGLRCAETLRPRSMVEKLHSLCAFNTVVLCKSRLFII